MIISMNAKIEVIFSPYSIGSVFAPSNLSPSISSISFTSSRAVVMTNAKNPRNMDVIIMLSWFNVNPPNTNPNPVINPTARFPINGVDFNL